MLESLVQTEPLFILIGTLAALLIFYRPYLGLLTMIFMVPMEELVLFSSGFTAIKVLGILTFTSFYFHCLLRKETIELNVKLFLPLILFLLWASTTPGGNLIYRLTRLFQL